MLDYGALTNLIYDAALDGGLWPRVLEHVSDAVGGGPTALLLQNQVTHGGAGLTVRLDPAALRDYYGAYANSNPLRRNNRIEAIRAMRTPVISTDQHVLDKREFVRTAYYNDFMRPNGMHASLMIGLAVEGDSAATFNVMRSPKAEEFGSAEIATAALLQPHLMRSFTLSRRLAEAQRTAAALDDALDRTPHAVFLIDASGRVRKANRAAEALLARNTGIALADGRLLGATQDATRRLQATIASASEGSGGGSLLLPRSGPGQSLSVIVAPIGKSGAGLFEAGPRALVCVNDPGATVAPPEQGLREMFGLTPAETRVALELLAGHATRAIAERIGISRNTVRVHLSRILEKTRTNRQAELVRVLLHTTGLYPD